MEAPMAFRERKREGGRKRVRGRAVQVEKNTHTVLPVLPLLVVVVVRARPRSLRALEESSAHWFDAHMGQPKAAFLPYLQYCVSLLFRVWEHHV